MPLRLKHFALAAWVAGVAWRIVHIVYLHPATAFVYSDMQFYHNEALRWCSGAPFGVKDMMHPPGTGLWYGMLCRLDASFRISHWCSALASCAVPLFIGALARLLYDRRVALIALSFASLYFPFIDFFALFISEGPFLFMVFPAFIALVLGLRHSGWRMWAALIAAGVGLGFCTMTRPVAMVWLLLVFLLLTIWHLRRAPKRWLVLVTGLGLGALAVLGPTAARCTRLNQGKFCIAGTMGPLNIVLGHVSDVRRVVWHDFHDGTYYFASSPVSFQNHSSRELALPFAAEDGAANMAYARKLFTEHPGNFVWQSLRELGFLIVGNFPWPTYETAWRIPGMIAEYLFWLLVMLPALVTLALKARPLLRLAPEAEAEALLLLPLIGSMAVSFLTVGETRYRVACDGFLMIVAAAAWARLPALFARYRAPRGDSSASATEEATGANVESARVGVSSREQLISRSTMYNGRCLISS